MHLAYGVRVKGDVYSTTVTSMLNSFWRSHASLFFSGWSVAISLSSVLLVVRLKIDLCFRVLPPGCEREKCRYVVYTVCQVKTYQGIISGRLRIRFPGKEMWGYVHALAFQQMLKVG